MGHKCFALAGSRTDGSRFIDAAIAAGAALLANVPRGFAATYDLVIKGGHVIDPSLRINEVRDVAISGGRGTLWGVFFGLLLLACVAPALTHLHIEAYWEKAIQGAIILLAVVADGIRSRRAAANA